MKKYQLTRREFVRFGAATLAVSPAALMAADVAGGACRTDGERLRIGILSDIHLKVKADKAKFVRALRAFRDERVDGVLICGYHAEQGLMLSVYDDRMSVRRLDFVNGRPLAAAWTIPLIGGERPFVHELRRAAAIVPEFPAGAKLAAKVREVERKKGARGKDLELTFPSVTGLHGGVRAYDYLATVTIESGEKSQKIEKRFFSPKCDRSPEADTEDVNVRFPLDDVSEWKSLRVSVRPREIFGGLGAPLEVKIVGIVPMKSSRSG